MIELTREEFKEWAFNPATQHFVGVLTDKRNDCLEQLGSGFYKDGDSIQKAIGICQSLKATIDAIESYKMEVQDDNK
jgi:hypothetical protein